MSAKNKKNAHPPGSKAACDAGCTCPVLDNNHGRGAYVDGAGNPVYWYDFACPLHGQAEHIDMQTVLYDAQK